MAMINHFFLESPLGTLTLVNADGSLCGVYMNSPSHAELGLRSRTGFEAAAEQLQEYFSGERTEFSLATDLRGTPFQQRVWKALLTIPYGETRTYAQIADAIGNRAAVRAVGLANGRNPISIVVPCHRVIGSDGSLVGYGGGLERKRFLLALENPGIWRGEKRLPFA